MASASDGFFRALRSKPVVAGLRRSADVDGAIRRGIGVLFILGEDIFTLQDSVAKAHASGRLNLAAGAIAISTGAQALWDYRRADEQRNR